MDGQRQGVVYDPTEKVGDNSHPEVGQLPNEVAGDDVKYYHG